MLDPDCIFTISMPRVQDDSLKLDWGMSPGNMDAIKETAEKIRAEL